MENPCPSRPEPPSPSLTLALAPTLNLPEGRGRRSKQQERCRSDEVRNLLTLDLTKFNSPKQCADATVATKDTGYERTSSHRIRPPKGHPPPPSRTRSHWF